MGEMRRLLQPLERWQAVLLLHHLLHGADLRVTKINGVELQSLGDIPAALEKAVNGFHKVEFDEDPRTIYLDAAQVSAVEQQVQQQYRLPSLKRLE